MPRPGYTQKPRPGGRARPTTESSGASPGVEDEKIQPLQILLAYLKLKKNASSQTMNNFFTLLRPLIGKNVASLFRSWTTLAGSALVVGGLLTADQTADGLQVGELSQIASGALLIFSARFINYVRAKALFGRSLSPLAEHIGPVMGRSIHSGIRALMTSVTGALVMIGAAAPGSTEADIANLDLAEIGVAAVFYFGARIYSYVQEKRVS